MRLQGGVSLSKTGLGMSISAMHLGMEIMGIGSENVTGSDKVGYQRKEPVVSSFAQYLGIHALSTAVDDQVGRIIVSQSPLDCALSEKGYFQLLHKDGTIELTRDGRFHLDKDGNLLSVKGHNVLSAGGQPIVFPVVPDELKDVKISKEGNISIFNAQTRKMVDAGKIAVVSSEGAIVTEPCVEQQCLEYSNVSLQQEFMELVPVKRNFDANRQLFMLQNSKLSRAIQELGSA
ncbi:TPA: hypothetical protein IAA68_06185 [Candidatus Galligastranaerophilus faecipullorum]|nr:hypothetical protein [Candidatus Galligastranaerophilus faecipullorum]